MTIKQKTTKQRKVVYVLKDAQPRFVSLVNHGANQTPFKVVKGLGSSIEENEIMAVNLKKVSFKKAAFTSVSACQQWMEKKGFEVPTNEMFTETDNGYVFATQDSEVSKSALREIDAQEGGEVVYHVSDEPEPHHEDNHDHTQKSSEAADNSENKDSNDNSAETEKSEEEVVAEADAVDNTDPKDVEVGDEADDEEKAEVAAKQQEANKDVSAMMEDLKKDAESFLAKYNVWKQTNTQEAETVTTETTQETTETVATDATTTDTESTNSATDVQKESVEVTESSEESLDDRVAKAVAEQLKTLTEGFEAKVKELEATNQELATKVQEMEAVEQMRKSATEEYGTKQTQKSTTAGQPSKDDFSNRVNADINGLRRR